MAEITGTFENDDGVSNDALIGTTGNDTIRGLLGNDLLRGGAGEDYLTGDVGADTVYGGAGDDTVFWRFQTGIAEVMVGGEGVDTLQIYIDTARVVSGNMRLDASDISGFERLEINATMGGFGGTMYMSPDLLNGFSEIDELSRVILTDGGRVDLSGLTLSDDSSNHGWIEGVSYGPATTLNDYISLEGSQTSWDIVGQNGSDTLIGGEQDDYLAALAGHADTLVGNGGDDLLVFGISRNQQNSALLIEGGAGNDTLRGTIEPDFVGIPEVSGGAGDDLVNLTYGSNWANDFRELQGLFSGGEGYDTLEVSRNVAFDFSGFEVFRGSLKASVDTLNSLEVIEEVRYLAQSVAGEVDFESATVSAGNVRTGISYQASYGEDRLLWSNATDMLTVSLFAGDDYTRLGSGADTVFGGNGDDLILSGGGADEVRGDAGNDSLIGGAGGDFLIGGSGNDAINGNAYTDLIYGGAGDDYINGGFAHDLINGGDGADRFFHLGVFDHGSDWVQDYDATEGDVIWFGIETATADQFQINYTHTATPAGERSGDDDVEEAFVIYRPTGQIIWALVDGAGQSSINLQIDEDVFDLLI
ncbi:calcium-binding protein [Shimia thalassica]|uniref:calcium-binding protein n=1 Tax=Shimia thalassica TaxID=1715693 RepID=UPI002735A0E4|nr:calcium-binding protein [Shimia thalassica]MDP2518273.1 calcium-binding protein [Shimia thalassica]